MKFVKLDSKSIVIENSICKINDMVIDEINIVGDKIVCIFSESRGESVEFNNLIELFDNLVIEVIK